VTRVRFRLQRTFAAHGVSRSDRNSATGVSAACRTRDNGRPYDVTLTTRDIMRLHGCSRATAYRILARGAAAGSLTLTTDTCVGGNGARQRRRVVVVEAA